jgi:hypothetical protein
LLTRRTASSFFCRCAKSYIDSTNTAAAPRYAAASETAAAPAAPAPAEADAATAATAASAATAAETTATSAAETTATTPAATATSTAAATMTATATAAAARYLREAGDAVFLVEEVECSKTYVGYFLLAKNEALIGRCVQGLGNVRSRNSRCGRASCQRKTKSGGTQGRHTNGFGPTIPLQSLFHPGHAASSMPVFRFQQKIYRFQVPNRKMLRFGQVLRKVEQIHNSLLHLQFQFALMNNAPRRHDRDRVQSGAGAQGTTHCNTSAVGDI